MRIDNINGNNKLNLNGRRAKHQMFGSIVKLLPIISAQNLIKNHQNLAGAVVNIT